MATKHEDEIPHKKPKVSKKLQPTAITAFLHRWNRCAYTFRQNNGGIRICQTRGMLISQAYLNGSLRKFENNCDFNLSISSTNLWINNYATMNYSGYSISFNWNNSQQIIAVMRLSKFTSLSLRLSLSPEESTTPNRVSTFIRLCEVIKGILFKYFSITHPLFRVSNTKNDRS